MGWIAWVTFLGNVSWLFPGRMHHFLLCTFSHTYPVYSSTTTPITLQHTVVRTFVFSYAKKPSWKQRLCSWCLALWPFCWLWASLQLQLTATVRTDSFLAQVLRWSAWLPEGFLLCHRNLLYSAEQKCQGCIVSRRESSTSEWQKSMDKCPSFLALDRTILRHVLHSFKEDSQRDSASVVHTDYPLSNVPFTGFYPFPVMLSLIFPLYSLGSSPK